MPDLIAPASAAHDGDACVMCIVLEWLGSSAPHAPPPPPPPPLVP